MTMLEWVGKTLASRIITALLALGTAAAGFWFWRNPEQLALVWSVIKYALAWLAFVAVLPWATFFLTWWSLRKDSNAAAALLLIGYTTVDAVVALWLAGGVRGHGTLTWVVFGFGFLTAAVYNYAVCEFITSRTEQV